MKKEKPEHMTRLSGDRWVCKTHDRIVFRGIIDSLEAEVIEAQVLAAERGDADLCASLGEVLDYLRTLMAAEVKEIHLEPPALFGMDPEEIHRKSQSPECYLLPAYSQGALAVRVNKLRAKVREVEVFAVRTFGPGGEGERPDIILGLNRLSSALWWLFCSIGSIK